MLALAITLLLGISAILAAPTMTFEQAKRSTVSGGMTCYCAY